MQSSDRGLDEPVNQLLAILPDETYQRLCQHLQPVKLPQQQILYNPGDEYEYAYFPSQAMISSVVIMKDGSTTEIGVVGKEGMIGLPIILDTSYALNSTVIVQVSGDGLKIAAKELQKEFRRHEELYNILMRYVQARIIQISQTAACNRCHKIEQQFARWLLIVSDSIGKDEFQLTQEFISQMLGVRRSGVTEIANKFQKANIIHYKRGKIKIIDREKLEEYSCECYQLVKTEFNRLIGNF